MTASRELQVPWITYWIKNAICSVGRLFMKEGLEITNREKYFHSFDQYLIEQWGDSSEKDEEKKRKAACEKMMSVLKGQKVAKNTTLRSWFGLKGRTKPGREHFFRLALALKLTPEKAQEYLQKGLLMPGIQVNDYREMIYYYGLEKQLSYEECQGMIEIFQSQLSQDFVLEQSTHTDELWELYYGWKSLDKIHFLQTMCENAGKFKGYGKTALKYYLKYRNEILEYVRQDSKLQLEMALQKTDFYIWVRQQRIPEEIQLQEVPRYIKNASRRTSMPLNQELKNEIQSLYWIVSAKEDRSADLIAEIYSTALEEEECGNKKGRKKPYHSRQKYNLPASIRFPTNAYLSHLLGVSVQKEKEIRISQALTYVRHQPEEKKCPDWVRETIEKYCGKREQSITCGQAYKYLKKSLSAQKKCCVMIQREDLLPLVHYVAQRRYEEMCLESYNYKDARRMFTELADTTLAACQMAPLKENQELDFLLLSCYRKKEMLSLAKIIENAKQE